MKKEKTNDVIKVYKCNSYEAAQRLFRDFTQMGLENLDEQLFFSLYEKGRDSIGFCVLFNTWQVCPLETSCYTIKLVELN